MADPIPTPTPDPTPAPPAPADPPAPPAPLLGGDPPAPAPEAPPEKPEGEKQTGDKPDAKPAGAPEKYEFRPIDGNPLDPALLGEFEPLFREANLPQEAAQKLVAKYASVVQGQAKAQSEAWGKTVSDWGVAAKADREIGGEGGAAFEPNLRAANAVLDKYGTPALKGLLGLPSAENPTGLGLGNHPELVRMFVRLAKAAGEDGSPPERTPPGDQRKPREEVFYGSTESN